MHGAKFTSIANCFYREKILAEQNFGEIFLSMHLEGKLYGKFSKCYITFIELIIFGLIFGFTSSQQICKYFPWPKIAIIIIL